MRSARAARARVAAAIASVGAGCATGTKTCTPLAPLVLTAPASPTSASASRTSRAVRAAASKGAPGGGSTSSTRCVCGWSGGSTRTSVGWYSTARWLANHSSVARSLQSGYVTSRFELSAQMTTVCTHGGAYRGRFFCMNGRRPRSARITDSGRSRSSPSNCSPTASR
jgi:hypothetical protein